MSINKFQNPFTRVNLSNKKNLLVVVSVFVVVAVGTTAFLFTNNENAKTNEGPVANSNFKDWLKPNSELKVGNNRYVSTCQVITPADVKEIFGLITAETNVTEEYLDTSVAADDKNAYRSYKTSCGYYPLVEIDANQYTEEDRVTNLANSMRLADPKQLEKAVSDYEIAANAADSANAKKIILKMKESLDLYKKNYKPTYNSTLTTDQTNGIILPSDPKRYEFIMLYDNVQYTFKVGGAVLAADRKPLSDPASAEILEQLEKLYERSIDHLRDTSLSQSPAPTIIDGDTEKHGANQILDACSVLSKELFANVTKTKPEETVKRTSVEPDVKAKKYATAKPEEPIYPVNMCDRTSKTDTLSDEASHSISIYLHSGDTHDAAIKKLKLGGLLPLKKPYSKVKTDAELAIKVSSGENDDTYLIAEGPYLIRLSYRIDKNSGGIGDYDFGTASDKKYIETINALVKSLKSDIKQTK
jgi:hypothetical protein